MKGFNHENFQKQKFFQSKNRKQKSVRASVTHWNTCGNSIVVANQSWFALSVDDGKVKAVLHKSICILLLGIICWALFVPLFAPLTAYAEDALVKTSDENGGEYTINLWQLSFDERNALRSYLKDGDHKEGTQLIEDGDTLQCKIWLNNMSDDTKKKIESIIGTKFEKSFWDNIADGFFNTVNALNPIRAAENAMSSIAKTVAEGLISDACSHIGDISTGMVTNSFQSLFGDDTAYNTIHKIATGFAQTLGYTVLGIVTIIQILKTTTRLDGNEQLPAVRDILMILLFFVVFKVLIDNAVDLCEYAYTAVSNFISEYIANPSMPDNISKTLSDNLNPNNGYFHVVMGGWLYMLIGLIFWLASWIAVLISYISILGRALQIYIYTCFAPVSLCFLANDETRQIGVGYCRNYLALLLAGVIICLIVLLFPYILSGVMAATGSNPLPIIAVLFVLCLGLVKSGAWAKEILGC